MTTSTEVYAKIAAIIRKQELPVAPVDHQHEELLYCLSRMDDPELREYGIRELNSLLSMRHSHSRH